MQFIRNYFEVLFSLTTEMAPYLLLGFLFAGILKVVVPPDLMSRYLGKSSASSVINASLLGVPLPLCSCGVLPAGISLYKNGASKGSSVSFLISTPQTGVDSVLVTWSMLGLPFALLRPIIAFLTGIMGGLLTNKMEKSVTEIPVEKKRQQKTKFSIKTILHYAFVEMVADIAKWLVIGLLIAALITVIVPDNFFTEFHLSGISSMLLILVVSIPLYICATASVPIAAVLLLKGLSPGALLVFLMAGPATNAATITVIGKNLGKKTLMIYLSSLIVGALFFGIIIDNLLPASWFTPLSLMAGDHQHEILPYWLIISSTVLFVALVLYSFMNVIIKKMKSRINKSDSMFSSMGIAELTLNVEGMTCVKCKAKVENEIGKIPNITSTIADPENNLLKVYGHELSAFLIGQKIEELGYSYKGINKAVSSNYEV
ncbi:MAG: permease [Bacteroidetes bacterium]|nr:permease [Bacteroidota bacterium]MBL6943866.1 permease [Bacteroidales bacterium]